MASEIENERIRLTDAERKAQRRRSIAIGGVLVAMVLLFYVITLIKMGS